MQTLLENRKKGLLFIISAPAGTGKTTLVQALTSEFEHVIASISYTTRAPRANEIHGRDYYFTSETEFQQRIEAADFLEHVQLYGVSYGTSKQWVEERLNEGKHVFLVIDTQGALLLKNKVSAISIFIRPPSIDTLRERLIKRGTESLEKINVRMAQAEIELKLADQYDYQFVNDQLKVAYEILKSIVIAECHRTPESTNKI